MIDICWLKPFFLFRLISTGSCDESPLPLSLVILTWLAVDDDALLMMGVAGGGQLDVQQGLTAVTAEQSPSPWSMAVLTWLTVDDDALLMVGVAGGGQQLVIQNIQQLLQLNSLPLLSLWLY
jgi:hypothetical protein